MPPAPKDFIEPSDELWTLTSTLHLENQVAKSVPPTSRTKQNSLSPFQPL
jgi:hypothetical protein